MTTDDRERLAFAFALAGNPRALPASAQCRLSHAGRLLLRVCAASAASVRGVGLECALRVWRHGLLPGDRERMFPTRDHYAAALRLARAVDSTTARELAWEANPEALLHPANKRRASRGAAA